MTLDITFVLLASALSAILSVALAVAAMRRRISEQAQAQSVKTLFKGMPEGLVLLDAQQQIVDLNPAAEKILGLSAHQLIGKTSSEALPLSHLSSTSEGVSGRSTAPTLKSDECGPSIDQTTCPISGQDSASEGCPLLLRDTLEFERELDTLRKTNERFRALVELDDGAVVMADRHGHITDWPPAAETILGFSAEEAIGEHLTSVLAAKEAWIRSEIEALNVNGAQSDTVQAHEVTGRSRDGKEFALALAIAFRDGDEHTPMTCIFRDISERQRVVEETNYLREFNEGIVLNMSEGIVIDDADACFTFVNPAAASMLGYSRDELIGKHTSIIVPPDQATLVEAANVRRASGITDKYELELLRKDGSRITVLVSGNPLTERGRFQGTMAVFTNISDRKRDEEQIRKLSRAVEQSPNAVIITDTDRKIEYVNPGFSDLTGYQASEVIGKSPKFLRSGEAISEDYSRIWEIVTSGNEWRGVLKNKKKNGDIFWASATISPVMDGQGLITHILAVEEDITERKRAEQAIQNQLATLSALYEGARNLTMSLDQVELGDYVSQSCVEEFGAHYAWIGRAESDGTVSPLTHYPGDSQYLMELKTRWDDTPEGQGSVGAAIRDGNPVIIEDIRTDPRFGHWRQAALDRGLCTAASFPLFRRGRAFGVLLLHSEQPGFFTPSRADFFQAYANLAAASLENARLLDEAERRMKHLSALRAIDMAITASLDQRVTFKILLDEVTAELEVDAASILLYNPHTHTLDFAAGTGFRTDALQRTRLRLGRGHAGRAALQRRTIVVEDLPREWGEFHDAPLLRSEAFISYIAVPLIAKGQVKGILEIFHRSRLDPDDEWRSFLDALATQAAIAIDNATLFDGLQHSNVELSLALDATLEGWARALEMRDQETVGHARRVTTMTTRLAREMGFSNGELVNARRGALLHDIGKMGIPDSILLKPGPLDDTEWQIMRKHPTQAYELLSPIISLRQALEIPYCHHEKWDGSGYPRGLKGDEIPLAARIFALIDVWDALLSDRPYREAWEETKVLGYIEEQSGKHFDPQIVELFMSVIKEAAGISTERNKEETGKEQGGHSEEV